MKKVISIVFNNFVNDSRVLKECQTLLRNNYDVSVIALHEGNLQEHEIVSGIGVHRIKLRSRKWSKSLFVQVFKYLETCFRILKQYRNAPDIIHCNDITPLPIAVLLKKLSSKRIKIVYDAHEFQTETQKLVGRKVRKKLVYWTEKMLIHKVDQVITVSEGISREYEKRYNITKPRLVLNCPLYQEQPKTNLFRERFAINDEQKIFLYQGALTPGRGIEKLLEAFKSVDQEKAALVFMGYGHSESLVKEAANAVPHIFYHEAVPPSEILRHTASADIGISLIENSCLNYYYCLPNKMFEYAMAGLPLLVSDLPEMKKIVEEYECGIVINKLTAEYFKKGIEEILENDLKSYSKNALQMAKEYHWGNQEKELLNIYDELVDREKATVY
jgi:glycosyltransferase involved in cell wall biosynthesis